MKKDFIKNKEQLIDSLNELINDCGNFKDIAQEVDEIIFDYLRLSAERKEVHCNDSIYLLKELRDCFSKLDNE